MYAFLEHTADIVLKAEAKSRAQLFIFFAKGIVYLFKEKKRLKKIRESELVFSIQGKDNVELLVEFLNALICLIMVRHFLPQRYHLFFSEKGLTVKLAGYFYKGALLREIKACTYHQAKVEKNRFWAVQVILDI